MCFCESSLKKCQTFFLKVRFVFLQCSLSFSCCRGRSLIAGGSISSGKRVFLRRQPHKTSSRVSSILASIFFKILFKIEEISMSFPCCQLRFFIVGGPFSWEKRVFPAKQPHQIRSWFLTSSSTSFSSNFCSVFIKILFVFHGTRSLIVIGG